MKETPTMKKALAVAGLGTAIALGTLVGAGTASAYPGADLDSLYVTCVAVDGLYNHYGPTALATYGRQIANDIQLGVRDPYQEREYVYYDTPLTISRDDANYLVNCATSVYLGFGPGSDGGSSGGSTLA